MTLTYRRTSIEYKHYVTQGVNCSLLLDYIATYVSLKTETVSIISLNCNSVLEKRGDGDVCCQFRFEGRMSTKNAYTMNIVDTRAKYGWEVTSTGQFCHDFSKH